MPEGAPLPRIEATWTVGLRRVPPGGATSAQSGQGRPQFEGKSEIQEIHVLGDWAYMWTKLTVVVTPPGSASPITRAGNTLTVLKKQSGKWVLARDANMLAVVQAT